MLSDDADLCDEVLHTVARAFRAWQQALVQAKKIRLESAEPQEPQAPRAEPRASVAKLLGSEGYRQLGVGRRSFRSPRLSQEAPVEAEVGRTTEIESSPQAEQIEAASSTYEAVPDKHAQPSLDIQPEEVAPKARPPDAEDPGPEQAVLPNEASQFSSLEPHEDHGAAPASPETPSPSSPVFAVIEDSPKRRPGPTMSDDCSWYVLGGEEPPLRASDGALLLAETRLRQGQRKLVALCLTAWREGLGFATCTSLWEDDEEDMQRWHLRGLELRLEESQSLREKEQKESAKAEATLKERLNSEFQAELQSQAVEAERHRQMMEAGFLERLLGAERERDNLQAQINYAVYDAQREKDLMEARLRGELDDAHHQQEVQQAKTFAIEQDAQRMREIDQAKLSAVLHDELRLRDVREAKMVEDVRRQQAAAQQSNAALGDQLRHERAEREEEKRRFAVLQQQLDAAKAELVKEHARAFDLKAALDNLKTVQELRDAEEKSRMEAEESRQALLQHVQEVEDHRARLQAEVDEMQAGYISLKAEAAAEQSKAKIAKQTLKERDVRVAQLLEEIQKHRSQQNLLKDEAAELADHRAWLGEDQRWLLTLETRLKEEQKKASELEDQLLKERVRCARRLEDMSEEILQEKVELLAGMGELVVSAIPEDQGGFDPLVILGVVWALTLFAGIVVGWACCRAPAPRTAAGEDALVAWERLTRRAIKFVNKRPTWDRVVTNLQIQDGGDPRPPPRALTPVEEARLESFRRVCRLRSGRPIDLPGDPAAATPAVAPAPFPAAGGAPAPAPGGPQARKLKLSAVLDPTLDAEIQPLGDAEVTGMYERYRNRYGDFPSVDADVSRDQLAALSQVLAAHAVPYADFSIFGPHGQRLLRRQTFQSYSLNVSTGEWAKKEQPGPGSFYEWYKAWRCYRTALLLLEAAEAERLDAYAEHIRGFVTQFGEEAWPFICKADSRMRSEQLERLRRELNANPTFGFTAAAPWNACYAYAVKDTEFWNKELTTPTTLFLPGDRGSGEPKPYGRGSAEAAIAAAQDPQACRAELSKDIMAESTKGPAASRQKLWATLAVTAGWSDPFHLDPNMIFTVMGALKTGGYRSAQLYLDTAKNCHIALGQPWDCQLQQAYRSAVRSCKRGVGHPKQAAHLPLVQVAELLGDSALAPGGPTHPVSATILASWWLLREIEASRARRKHVTIEIAALKASWRLPSSKTDQAALGATRSHTCACSVHTIRLCPFHVLLEHLDRLPDGPEQLLFPAKDGLESTKKGWADTFEAIAKRLQLPTVHDNGARAYTGHSARVTGARFMAMRNIELWRIQLFGRWGSDVFLHYIQDAPVAQLDRLALESTAAMSVRKAQEELSTLQQRIKDCKATFMPPESQMLEDCEASVYCVQEALADTACFLILYILLASFGFPYDITGGNHDLEGIDEFGTDDANLAAYLKFLGKERTQFSHEIAEKTLLVGLGSTSFRSARYSSHEVTIDPDQLQWFEDTIQMHPASEGWQVFVFTHAPILGSALRVLQENHVLNGCCWLNHSDGSSSRKFIQIVRENPCIKGWFSGHFHLSHDYEDSITFPGGNRRGHCVFAQTGVMRSKSSRDGRQQSRLVRGNSQGYEMYTIDHKKDGELRLDATVLYSDSCDVPEDLILDLDPTECSTISFAHQHEDYDHDLWFSAYVPKEDDGCLVEPRGTLNRDGVDLDFANGDQVCWWHMKDGAILGVHGGMILEYDASTFAPLGMVVSRDELQNRRVAVIDDGWDGSALVLYDDGNDVTVVQPNEDGSYWRRVVRNKMHRIKEMRRMAAAASWAKKAVLDAKDLETLLEKERQQRKLLSDFVEDLERRCFSVHKDLRLEHLPEMLADERQHLAQMTQTALNFEDRCEKLQKVVSDLQIYTEKLSIESANGAVAARRASDLEEKYNELSLHADFLEQELRRNKKTVVILDDSCAGLEQKLANQRDNAVEVLAGRSKARLRCVGLRCLSAWRQWLIMEQAQKWREAEATKILEASDAYALRLQGRTSNALHNVGTALFHQQWQTLMVHVFLSWRLHCKVETSDDWRRHQEQITSTGRDQVLKNLLETALQESALLDDDEEEPSSTMALQIPSSPLGPSGPTRSDPSGPGASVPSEKAVSKAERVAEAVAEKMHRQLCEELLKETFSIWHQDYQSEAAKKKEELERIAKKNYEEEKQRLQAEKEAEAAKAREAREAHEAEIHVHQEACWNSFQEPVDMQRLREAEREALQRQQQLAAAEREALVEQIKAARRQQSFEMEILKEQVARAEDARRSQQEELERLKEEARWPFVARKSCSISRLLQWHLKGSLTAQLVPRQWWAPPARSPQRLLQHGVFPWRPSLRSQDIKPALGQICAAWSWAENRLNCWSACS
ncbi:Hypothetical protein SCF082_LOCUS10063 [Durusdinium trenchii]|uniref:Uncharacterized protein n=1 Tax=Durusdinium trenchii TaxID=1381693 RepID=A0ABP0J3F3_9DINO